MTVDLEAANAALRLDSDLLPPVGATISYKDGPWEAVSVGMVRTQDTVLVGWDRRKLAGLFVAPRNFRSPVFVLAKEVRSIVHLPDYCPPIAEWKCISDVLKAA
jgi:hypothetical protein